MYLDMHLLCLQVIKEERCNGATLLPYMLVDILQRFDGGTTEPFHLDWALTGGDIIQGSIVKV